MGGTGGTGGTGIHLSSHDVNAFDRNIAGQQITGLNGHNEEKRTCKVARCSY